MGDWLSFYLVIWITYIKNEASSSQFYDNNDVDSDVQ